MENKYELKIDLQSGESIMTKAKYRTGDTNSAKMEVTLVNEGLVQSILGEDITWNFEKADHTHCTQNMTNGVSILDAENGVLLIVFENQTLSCPGLVRASITFVKDGIINNTIMFAFTVNGTVNGGDLSIDYITAIETKIAGWQSEIDVIKAGAVVKTRIGMRVNIKNTDWATQGPNWSSLGSPVSTMVFNPSYATVSGGDGTLTQCHVYTPYTTVSKRTTVKAKVQCVNGSVAGQYGLALSLLSTNMSNRCSFQTQLITDPNDGASEKITFYLNQTLTKNNGNAKLPPTNPMDVIEMTITSDNTAVFIKFNNITQGVIISHVFRWDAQNSNPTNIFQLGFSCFGGVWNILELTCVDNEVQNPELLFIGDSLSSGVTGISNMKTGRDFPSIIAQRFPTQTISRWCGGGDTVNLYIGQSALSELLLRKPKYAFMLIGLNDIGLYGRTLAQLQADYIVLINALKANGTIIIHGGMIPNISKDTRPFNTWVKNTYINDLNIDMFSPLAEVGVCPLVSGGGAFGLNAFWLADSATHLNEAGDFRVADVITMFLIENNIFNPSQMLNIVP